MTQTLCTSVILAGLATLACAEVKITPEYHAGGDAIAGFKFSTVPAPMRGDAGAKAKITLVDGERDGNGADVKALNDGAVPTNEDQPRANFFFRPATDGGRIVVDLGSEIEIGKINTFSWHPSSRGPQVYKVYLGDTKATGFNREPKRPEDPTKVGWKLLGSVDTRSKSGEAGGQHGVSITDTVGSLGKGQFLLFDIFRTNADDTNSNTFLSEIDVVDRNAAETSEVSLVDAVETTGGAFRFTVDTTEAPDLTEWSRKELIPVMQKWYPMIVDMLPSDGFKAPRTFSINFTNSYRGVAATMGNRIEGSPSWYRSNLKTEALGSLVHELVHVVQQYGGRRSGGERPPGWLTEGIPDYIRWYLYEPESRGAEINPRSVSRVNYDNSYRVSANFLNFVITKYDKDLIKTLNAAMRDGKYTSAIWKERTGLALEELGAEWKKSLEAPKPQAAR